MQGLALYSGTSSFMHKLNTDSVSSFELTAINTNTLSTGIHWLDTVLSRLSMCEAVLYFPGALSLTSLGVLGVSYASTLLFSTAVSDVFFLRILRSQLSANAEIFALSYKHVYSAIGVNHDMVYSILPGFMHIVESLDVLLLGLELFCAVLLFAQLATLKGRLQRQVSGYDDVVTFCQVRGISVTEIFGLLTFALGFIFFDMFVTLAEDDSLEALSYVFASVIVCAVVLLFLAADVQFYFLISSISGGELTLRVLYTDIVNNGLCLLRIFFCWIRYLFYDLQAELVDLAFHYTEVGDEAMLESFASFDRTESSYL
jgi:hypothetical protein